MNSHQNILVCVTQQKTCERLIRSAAKICQQVHGNLFVLHVAKNEWNFLDNIREGEALEYLFVISKSVGADLTVLRSDKIVESISEFAKEHYIDTIFMGETLEDHKENKFYRQLKSYLPYVSIKVIPQD